MLIQAVGGYFTSREECGAYLVFATRHFLRLRASGFQNAAHRLEPFQPAYAEHREDAWCAVKKGDGPQRVRFPEIACPSPDGDNSSIL
jgi:hypothetical protein